MTNSTVAKETVNPRRIFNLLLLYRWLSLSIPLAAWLLMPNGLLLTMLLAATAVNILISLVSTQLNRALRHRAWLLTADLVLMAVFIAYTGGWRSPFYLYALSPLLIAAFFFGLRGAIKAATAFLIFYAIALIVAMNQTGEPPNWLLIVTTVVGFFLISGTFGYAAGLLSRLRQTRDELVFSHQELNMLHALTLSLQSAANVEEVQEKVLEAVTAELGFPKAVIGLVDAETQVITGWLGRVRDGHISDNGQPIHPIQAPLTPEGGLLAQSLLTRKSMPTNNRLNRRFQITDGYMLPLFLREHPIGIMLVDVAGVLDEEMGENGRFASLNAVAGQAAVAIGTTSLCINRARQVAVQEERIRIARDLHDNVSQSLFGIVYTLDGSLKLLSQEPEAVRPELERALKTADQARAAIRHSILDIWPSELTAERFTADLQKYVHDSCLVDGLQIEFDVRGKFNLLSPQVRRSLYRIAQEALANVARHAAAGEAHVCIDVAQGRAQLVVRDDGRGFEPEAALAREYGREHFGLRGIQERAQSLDGECHIFSQPGAGASIVIDVPASEKWTGEGLSPTID